MNIPSLIVQDNIIPSFWKPYNTDKFTWQIQMKI